MSDDLVKRMRKRAEFTGPYSPLWDEAADRIEQLEAALRLYMDMMAANKIDIPHTYEVARAALTGEKKDD